MFKHCFVIILIILSFSTLSSVEANEIKETNKISEVIPLIDEETWFLVDLDNTVFQTKQALGHVDWFQHEVEKLTAKGKSREDAFHSMYPLWKKAQGMTEVMPVDPDFLQAITHLQDRGIVVMGLTHRQLFIITETQRQIESLGLDFRRTAPSQQIINIEGARPSQYTQGVLFVDDFNSKGERFLSLLQKIGKKPKKIVFIDDKKKNVEDVAKAAISEGIEYIGIYYTAAADGPKVYSPEWADIQTKFLNSILSNQQAEGLLTKEKANSEQEGVVTPKYLYKIISWKQWQESLRDGKLLGDTELLSEEQVAKNIQNFWKTSDHVIVKISLNQLNSPLVLQSNQQPHYLIEKRTIPLDAISEITITHLNPTDKVL